MERAALCRILIVALFAAGVAGCHDEACVPWNKAAQGACPTQDQAIDSFGGDCSDFASIDSAPDFRDDAFCCYDVTRKGSNQPLQRKCAH